MRDETAFREFVEANGATLLHAARLLTGDYQRAEDLVQTALTKVYVRWGRAREPLAYTRRVLVSTHIDGTRRRWRGERPTGALPEEPTDGGLATSDERDELRRMLRDLTSLERAVVVLRYYCDLTEKDTAASLRIPVGTVKSAASRALARLRVEAIR
ncbi:MAG TPA: SigE family RNA polymerase sigma factor [Jatrophihabitantaceae bacterium]|nr:SigE family RNA polymerase sigma factor [Jatrophihabitantaceae bacterium]